MKVSAISKQNFGSNEIIISDLTKNQCDIFGRVKPVLQRGLRLTGINHDLYINGGKQRWGTVGANKQVVDMSIKNGKELANTIVQIGDSPREWIKAFRKLANINMLDPSWVKLCFNFMRGRI